MDLTNSRRKNSPQLLDQSKHRYISIFSLSADTFQSDQIEEHCQQYDMSNIHVSPDVNFNAIAAG